MASIKQRINILISQMSLDERNSQRGSRWIYELQRQGDLWGKGSRMGLFLSIRPSDQ